MLFKAPRPSTGPHKLRECLPIVILLRNRLKYALTKREVTAIVAQRLIKVDGKVRTDICYPAGYQGIFFSFHFREHTTDLMLYNIILHQLGFVAQKLFLASNCF